MAQLVDVETDILTNFRGAFCLWFQILIQFLLRAIRFLPPNPDPHPVIRICLVSSVTWPNLGKMGSWEMFS